MEIEFENNIVWIGYDDYEKMKTKILELLLNFQIGNVLYKGSPDKIYHKIIKKMLIDKTNYREQYYEKIKNTNFTYCLIYKKDEIKNNKKNYYEENKEKAKAYRKKYEEDNKEKIIAKREANKEKKREANRLYREKKKKEL